MRCFSRRDFLPMSSKSLKNSQKMAKVGVKNRKIFILSLNQTLMLPKCFRCHLGRSAIRNNLFEMFSSRDFLAMSSKFSKRAKKGPIRGQKSENRYSEPK